jgi:hypothetical protein
VTQFRIQTQPVTGRVIRTINLDTANEHEVAQLVANVADADLVAMIVSAGNDAHAAAIIGEACSARRVMTHTAIVRAAQATDEALSRTLAQVRPWSLMVVVANEDDYVDDILKSFR